MEDALNKAVELCGSQSELARRIGVKQAHVWSWLKRGKAAPEFCRAIEAATARQVTRYELRPDVFGPPPTQASEQDRRTGPPDRREPAAYGRRVERDRRHHDEDAA